MSRRQRGEQPRREAGREGDEKEADCEEVKTLLKARAEASLAVSSSVTEQRTADEQLSAGEARGEDVAGTLHPGRQVRFARGGSSSSSTFAPLPSKQQQSWLTQAGSSSSSTTRFTFWRKAVLSFTIFCIVAAETVNLTNGITTIAGKKDESRTAGGLWSNSPFTKEQHKALMQRAKEASADYDAFFRLQEVEEELPPQQAKDVLVAEEEEPLPHAEDQEEEAEHGTESGVDGEDDGSEASGEGDNDDAAQYIDQQEEVGTPAASGEDGITTTEPVLPLSDTEVTTTADLRSSAWYERDLQEEALRRKKKKLGEDQVRKRRHLEEAVEQQIRHYEKKSGMTSVRLPEAPPEEDSFIKRVADRIKQEKDWIERYVQDPYRGLAREAVALR